MRMKTADESHEKVKLSLNMYIKPRTKNLLNVLSSIEDRAVQEIVGDLIDEAMTSETVKKKLKTLLTI